MSGMAGRQPGSEPQAAWAGGCQCGAVRYKVSRLGRAGICHCRMCQKATGGYFGPFVTVLDLTWMRGQPKYFQSSNRARRGFCENCGTPLTYETDLGSVDIAMGTFDRAAELRPVIAVGLEGRVQFFDELHQLPEPDNARDIAAYRATIVSNQHPDHDTTDWPPVK
jgi:hypothetical protein